MAIVGANIAIAIRVEITSGPIRSTLTIRKAVTATGISIGTATARTATTRRGTRGLRVRRAGAVPLATVALGLTGMESRVAALLAEGRSVQEVAAAKKRAKGMSDERSKE